MSLSSPFVPVLHQTQISPVRCIRDGNPIGNISRRQHVTIAQYDAKNGRSELSSELSSPPSQQHLLRRIRHNSRLKEDILRPLRDRLRELDLVIHQKMAQDGLDFRLRKVPPWTCVPAVTKGHGFHRCGVEGQLARLLHPFLCSLGKPEPVECVQLTPHPWIRALLLFVAGEMCPGGYMEAVVKGDGDGSLAGKKSYKSVSKLIPQ